MIAKRKWIVFLCLIGMLWPTAIWGKTEPREKEHPPFSRQVEAWIKALAEQKGFESFKEASWTSVPLGPGTHGRLVLISVKGQPVGYLIASATPEGMWLLSEYGQGEYPPFGTSVLENVLGDETGDPANLKMEKIYFDPFHAVWKWTTPGQEPVVADAVSGEILPLLPDDLRRQRALTAKETPLPGHAPARVEERAQFPTFDPFENIGWLTGEKPLPLMEAEEVVAHLKRNHRLVFAAKRFEEKIITPYPVIGFHRWDNGQIYLQVDSDGFRWISFPYFSQYGRFFP